MFEKMKKVWQTIWNMLIPIVTLSNIFSWKFHKDKNELEITTRISTILIVGFILGCLYMWYRYGPFSDERDLSAHNPTTPSVVQIDNNQANIPVTVEPLEEPKSPLQEKRQVSHRISEKPKKRKERRKPKTAYKSVSYSNREYRVRSNPYIPQTYFPDPVICDPFGSGLFIPEPSFVECYAW